jgi:acyl-coenzyme A thioesterase PaaI-like protein
MLGAMLDDLTALMVAATLQAPDEGVVTISLNVFFLRPAVSGPITGLATLVRRGRELCHVNGKDIAWAVAICKLVRG